MSSRYVVRKRNESKKDKKREIVYSHFSVCGSIMCSWIINLFSHSPLVNRDKHKILLVTKTMKKKAKTRRKMWKNVSFLNTLVDIELPILLKFLRLFFSTSTMPVQKRTYIQYSDAKVI